MNTGRVAFRIVGAAALALGASGCAWFGGADSGAVDAASPQAPRTRLSAAAETLMQADRAFAARAAERGTAEAFHEFLDAKGLRVAASGAVPTGPQEVWASLAAAPKSVLHWEPRYAEVFAPGDWGWTWGDWQTHEPGAGGRRLAQGRYVTVWRKQADGSWKVRGTLPGEAR